MSKILTAQILTAAAVVRLLDLKPHPEGGHFREIFRDTRQVEDGRAASTAIYFLLAWGERSHWHRVDAVEIWHWHAGAPLELEISQSEGRIERITLGNDLASRQRPQAIVPAHAWQAAQTVGDWTLCGCTVAPGFEFKHFELAPKGWAPQPARPRPRPGKSAAPPRPERPRRPPRQRA